MKDRKNIAARIRALLQMTEANGCTEAEAMSAAEKARELMDRHHIDMSAAEVEAEGTAQAKVYRKPFGHLHIKDLLHYRIALYCDCLTWREPNTGQIVFLGTPSDAEFSAWMLEALTAFIGRCTIEYIAGRRDAMGKRAWQIKKAFALGAVGRINDRLEALIAERKAKEHATNDGRALIVLKSALVQQALKDLGIRLRGRKQQHTYSDQGAHDAGEAAGDRASFARPVNAGGTIRQIGGR